MANRLTKIEIDELSLVDSPADPNAKVQLFKREDDEDEIDPTWAEEMIELGKAQPASTDVIGGGVLEGKKRGPMIRLRGKKKKEDEDGLYKMATMGAVYEAEIHRHFTNMADGMYANGNLTRDERIGLSNAIGDALDSFVGAVEENHPQLYTRGPYEQIDSDGMVEKRDFSIEERKNFASKGIALSDGSYPIPDRDALRRAIQAYGRSKPDKRAQVISHIRRRAVALGAENMVPDSFKKLKGWDEGQESTSRSDEPHPAKVKKTEGNMPDNTKTSEVILDLSALPDEVKTVVEEHIAGLTKRAADAEAEAKEAKAEVDVLKAGDGNEGNEEEILKNADPAIREMVEKAQAEAAEATAIAKAERDARLNREFLAKAESLPFVPGETKRKADILKSASASLTPEDYIELETMFKSMNEVISKSAMFKSIGSSAFDEGSPQGKVEKLAKTRADEKSISYEQAYTEVLNENPDLYEEMEMEEVS